jgi:uncharacterized membrane protein
MDNTSASPTPAASAWRIEAAGVLLLTLLAFGLRLHRLDFQPLWGDEGWSFYFASLSLGELLRLTAEDIHPPLYYTVLAGWLRLAGSTPESARFLSVLFGTMLVPLAYRLAGRLFDRMAGLSVAAVITLAPMAVYYSQEVRMYGLVTLLGLASVYFFVQLTSMGSAEMPSKAAPLSDAAPAARHVLGYILTTAAALYTMYYAVFIPAFQLAAFAALPGSRRLRRWTAHPFLRSLFAAGLLYLPWVVYAGTRLASYVQGKRAAEGYAPLDLLRFTASHLAAFSVGHLSPATRPLAWTTVLFLSIALLGFTASARRTSQARPRKSLSLPRHALLLALYLLLPLLFGYLVNLVYPFTPRYFERTLLLAAPAWWLLVGAGLGWLWRRRRYALLGVGALLLLIQVVLLLDFYGVARYREEDYRPLMSYVGAQGSPDDVFVASYQWQVGYYYAYLSLPRPALYPVPGWGEVWAADPARMRADLDALLGTHARVWFPAYQALGRMWETDAEAYLNRFAFPVQVDWRLRSTKLLLYIGGGHLAPLRATFNFANRLLLAEAETCQEPVEAGRGVVPVTLTWRKLDQLWNDHRVSLRLADSSGRTWASRDSLPQGGEASFTELAKGEELPDHHGLAIPAGTPPGDYELRVSIYDVADERALDLLDDRGQPQGVEAILASVQVIPPARPLPAAALPVQHPSRTDFDGRVRLLGYSLGSGPFQAGDPLTFSLFWQSLVDDQPAYVVFAQLQDETGRPVALSETPPVYPSEHWSAGGLLRDPREIPLPATLPAGTYRLAVGLLEPDRTRVPAGRGDQAVLTRVETTQRPHGYAAPSPQHTLDARFGTGARLIGFDLPDGSDVRPGQSLALSLHWQSLATWDRSYTVFVHLVDADGRIVAQRDQVPGNGRFPTTSWVPEEYLKDSYFIPVDPDTPPGDYWIEIGLYNPLDRTRLPVADEDGRPLGDRLLLGEMRVRVKTS